MRQRLLSILLLLIAANVSRAVENKFPLPLLTAADLAANAAQATGPKDRPAIQVTGGAATTTTAVVNCTAPSIETHQYVVRGDVKYEGVVGDGYLELWNDFGSKGEFFSRSLADWGTMGKLTGTSKWRKFELPFFGEPGWRPEKLTLNVVLPGAGTVIVSQPTLVIVDISNQWWTEQQASIYGGVMGAFLGTLGATIGVLAAWGKLKQLTLSLFGLGLAISGIALVAGVVAVGYQQPWHVYYPLLLVGVIGVSVLGGNLWNVLRRYRSDELRRMAAVDA